MALVILESATSGQSFQVQFSVEEEWLDLDSSFLSNTAVASVPNEMLQKVVLLFSVTYRPLKNFTFLKFYIVFNLKTILKRKLKQIYV